MSKEAWDWLRQADELLMECYRGTGSRKGDRWINDYRLDAMIDELTRLEFEAERKPDESWGSILGEEILD